MTTNQIPTNPFSIVEQIVVANWGPALTGAGFDLQDLAVLDFDNGSSNFNNHHYLIRIGAHELVLFRDTENLESPFDLGAPCFQRNPS